MPIQVPTIIPRRTVVINILVRKCPAISPLRTLTTTDNMAETINVAKTVKRALNIYVLLLVYTLNINT